jgi:hypothetical protein
MHARSTSKNWDPWLLSTETKRQDGCCKGECQAEEKGKIADASPSQRMDEVLVNPEFEVCVLCLYSFFYIFVITINVTLMKCCATTKSNNLDQYYGLLKKLFVSKFLFQFMHIS